jgi:hypothetical protein
MFMKNFPIYNNNQNKYLGAMRKNLQEQWKGKIEEKQKRVATNN